MTEGTKPATCPACGSPADANYCSQCGLALAAPTCRYCRAELSEGARFCHRCARPTEPAAAPRSERAPWIIAGATITVLLAAIVYRVVAGGAPGVAGAPDMANPGGVVTVGEGPAANGGAANGPAGAAPDISNMSPRERFDRLFNRIMTAASQGDTATVVNFTPMGLGAYQMLDSVDTDARYHAAVLHAQVGDYPPALALADTILANHPGHLFGYMIRGAVAEMQGDSSALRAARRGFLAHYDSELQAGRPEYAEHRPVIDDFKRQAEEK